MPRLDAPFTTPENTTTEVTDSAHTAFQNEEAELFRSLGLNDGGFQANAYRVFMLDDTDKLVTPPPYDSEKDKNMTAAAQNGRLYIMDKDRRLRQVRLEGNENDGFAFAVTNPLSRKQRPMGLMEFYAKQLSTIFNEFVSNVKRDWAESDERRAERRDSIEEFFDRHIERAEKDSKKGVQNPFAFLDKFYDLLQDFFWRIDKYFESKDKVTKQAESKDDPLQTEQTEIKAENEPLIPEEEPVQTEQTVNTPEEEQIQQADQPDMTTEQLLATNPTNLTNDQFLTYLDALDQRGKGAQISDVMKNEKATAANYYEALAQDMEGQVAQQIKAQADGQTDPEVKEQFLKEQKPIMASISQGLREYVKENSNQAVVNEYFDARAKGTSTETMEKNVLQDSKTVQAKGVSGYLETVNNSNAAMRQTQSQPPRTQPNQVQQMQAKHQMQGMGGRG